MISRHPNDGAEPITQDPQCPFELGDQLSIPGVHSFVSSAEAIVGRPLTPVSYAGVARRTVRRCAVGVYYC